MSTRALRHLCIATVLALAAMVLPAFTTLAQAAPPATASAAAPAVDRPVARVFDRLRGFRLDTSRPVTIA
ncbi:MAG: hypothetical protein WCS84_08045, partial [Nocardioides sp.]